MPPREPKRLPKWAKRVFEAYQSQSTLGPARIADSNIASREPLRVPNTRAGRIARSQRLELVKLKSGGFAVISQFRTAGAGGTTYHSGVPLPKGVGKRTG